LFFRKKQQAEANMANVQSVYELRAIKQAEFESEQRNLKAMAFEDVMFHCIIIIPFGKQLSFASALVFY
jgi:hypothetical protein